MSESAATEIHWATAAKTDSSPVIRIGVLSIGVVLAIFLAWGSIFELSSAVITPGTLVSEGRNKLIQHSTGGRIKEIFIQEGEMLARGQVVLELDPAQAQADLSKLNARHASLSALKFRLDAERSGGVRSMRMSKPVFRKMMLRGGKGIFSDFETPSSDDETEDDLVQEIDFGTTGAVAQPDDSLMRSQRDAYQSGRALLTKEVSALEKKINTLRNQRGGVEARLSSQRRLLALSKQELSRLRPLAAEGYVARNRIIERQRSVVEMEGSIETLLLDIKSYQSQIDEVQTQVERARIANSDAASIEYARIVAELAEVSEQRVAAREVVEGLVVRAPVAGKLTKLSVTTNGGVISGGDVVGEIVPEGAPLLVEARVAPSDINYVLNGQKADIAITAFDRRLEDTLNGEVVYVSADSQKDEKTNEQYFIARLKLLSESPADSAMIAKLQAGMQGEVYIHSGSRTFLAYLAKPLIDSFRKSFRER